jgi:UDP-glucose 4-epimerase
VWNGAADGVLVLSEVIDLLGKRWAPVIPPWGTSRVARPLRALGLKVPDEMLNQLRFGRALDNRRLKAAGYRFAYTTRETVTHLREHQRLAALTRHTQEPYRYERELEDFLRWSPSVRSGADRPEPPAIESRASRRQLAEVHQALETLGVSVPGAPTPASTPQTLDDPNPDAPRTPS